MTKKKQKYTFFNDDVIDWRQDGDMLSELKYKNFFINENSIEPITSVVFTFSQINANESYLI